MAERLFLDFDGTLIDPRLRLYSLFCDLAPENQLSFDAYWERKRGRINQRDLLEQELHYSPTQVAAFKCAWMEQVEDSARLAMDTPFEGVSDFLAQAAARYRLYLVTARQHPDRVDTQLACLGWREHFSGVLVTGQHQSKDALIRDSVAYNSSDILVGDTGEDILAGKALGLITVAVSSGVLSAAILEEYAPDQLLSSVVMLDV